MEKYEIIIKENGEEKQRVRAKGVVFTAVREEGIHKLAMADGISGLEIALMTNANETLIDSIWENCGVTSRKAREEICGLVRMAQMMAEKENEE